MPLNAGPGIPIDAVYVYETHDGGQTWSYLRRLDQLGVVFQDGTHWLRVGPDGIAFSTDAGGTWSPERPVPQPAGWSYGPPTFIGSTGWALLQQHPASLVKPGPPTPGAQPVPRYAVIRTTDGGVHWTEGELPPP